MIELQHGSPRRKKAPPDSRRRFSLADRAVPIRP
jgi:hypothetical protein